MVVVVEFLHQSSCVIGTVVLDDIRRVQVIYFVDILTEFGSRGSLDFLHLLQTFAQDKSLFSLVVVLQVLGELVEDVLKNIRGSLGNEGFKCGQVRAHLQDALKRFLGLLLQVFASILEFIHSQQVTGHISLGHGSGVIGRVTTNLAQRPGGGSLD